jgi:hypothetical protein
LHVAKNGTLRTLADYVEWKCALHITCRRCRHGTVVYLPSLIEKYGPTAELAELTPRFVCGECGAQMANVEPMMR